MSSRRKAPLTAAAIAVLATGSIATADISETVFIVQASNANGTATYAAHFLDGRMDHESGTFDWTLSGSRMLRSDNGTPIAMLNDGLILGLEDPSVSLNFNVFSGSLPTVFTITSATVSFSPLVNAQGRASASLSATDLNGDGASLTAGPGAGGTYTAYYNGGPISGTIFHELLTGPVTTAIAGDTATASQDFPGGGAFQTIPGAITDITSRFRFTLSANDLASGTSIFTVQVPSPGPMALLGLGGLLVGRRRTR